MSTRISLLLIACCLLHISSGAQDIKRHKIALFTPLYLDSAFDASGNDLINKSFPKYINAGLDFYLGAQAALDSLQKRGAPLEVFVYDTRSATPLATQVNNPDLADVEMMIGHTNLQETRTLAEAARQKKVPFISATLPNDAGVLRNPYLAVLNATLQSHIEAIYRLMQKNFSQQRIIIFRKPGAQEDQLKNYFMEAAKSQVGASVAVKYVDLPANFSPAALSAQLDSTKKNICIAGSLDEKFGIRLAQSLSALNKTYPVTLVGMPTWESFNFGKTVGNLEIIYSTPFNYSRNSSLEISLTQEYYGKTNGKPTDLYFRGYETMLRFALLLLDTDTAVASSLGRKGNYVFTQFDMRPVIKNKLSPTADYYENKHLYFIRLMNGNKSLYSW